MAWPLQSQCDSFYGNPRGSKGTYSPKWAAANLVHVACPWPLHTEDVVKKKVVRSSVPFITIHKKCADSLKRVLASIFSACDKDVAKIAKLHYDVFDGSFNYRPKRGASSLSMHAYGCAIDWDAADNPFHSRKHEFQSDSLLVVKFEEEGWIWGGRWSNPDAMHVQAARLR